MRFLLFSLMTINNVLELKVQNHLTMTTHIYTYSMCLYIGLFDSTKKQTLVHTDNVTQSVAYDGTSLLIMKF